MRLSGVLIGCLAYYWGTSKVSPLWLGWPHPPSRAPPLVGLLALNLVGLLALDLAVSTLWSAWGTLVLIWSAQPRPHTGFWGSSAQLPSPCGPTRQIPATDGPELCLFSWVGPQWRAWTVARYVAVIRVLSSSRHRGLHKMTYSWVALPSRTTVLCCTLSHICQLYGWDRQASQAAGPLS